MMNSTGQETPGPDKWKSDCNTSSKHATQIKFHSNILCWLNGYSHSLCTI